MIGVPGATRSFEAQACSSDSTPLVSATRSATTAPLRMAPFVARAPDGRPEIGTRIQRDSDAGIAPLAAVFFAHVESASAEIDPPLPKSAREAASGVAW